MTASSTSTVESVINDYKRVIYTQYDPLMRKISTTNVDLTTLSLPPITVSLDGILTVPNQPDNITIQRIKQRHQQLINYCQLLRAF